MMSSSSSSVLSHPMPLSAVLISGCATLVLATALAYVLLTLNRNNNNNNNKNNKSSDTTTDGSNTKKSGSSSGGFLSSALSLATSRFTNLSPSMRSLSPRSVMNSSTTNNSNKRSTTTASTTAAGDGLDWSRYPGGAITVYYATQTGTAETFARALEREGPSHGFYVRVADLEDAKVEDLVDDSRRDSTNGDGGSGSSSSRDSNKSRIIILAATYGEGESPDNAVQFVQALAARAATQVLFQQKQQQSKETVDDAAAADAASPSPDLIYTDKLEYGVFGLGNLQYDHYNAMGKFFDHALERCGGTRVVPLGLGNDDEDLEADFENWKDNQLWPILKQRYVVASNLSSSGSDSQSDDPAVATAAESASLPECQYVVEYHPVGTAVATPPYPNISLDQVHSHSRHYFTAVACPVSIVRELRTSSDPGSTVHVEIDISQSSSSAPSLIKYETADNLGVVPENDPTVVESVAHALHYDLNQVFSLRAARGHDWHGVPFPMPVTVRECLSRYCDLTSAPRRSDLKLLASYATDRTDQQALRRMAAKEGRVEYREKIVDGYVGLVHLLKLCPSITMPLEHFLSYVSPLQTRFYTISSSSSVHPQSIHLTVAVSTTTRPDGTRFEGVCSSYLANKREYCWPGGPNQASNSNGMVRVFVRPSSFRLPSDPSRPILMIGPGTGVAPMRAMLQERAHQRNVLHLPVGTNTLYFGCKRANQDYLYREELAAYQSSGVLTTLRVAFSRETSDKVYVQHLLRQHGAETWELLDKQGAYMYVCGGVRMGQDVHEALQDIIVTHSSSSDFSPELARQYLNRLSQEGRYVQELWA